MVYLCLVMELIIPGKHSPVSALSLASAIKPLETLEHIPKLYVIFFSDQ
jgi:hypothetical protein